MPFVDLKSTKQLAKTEAEQLLQEHSSLVAANLSKPEAYVMTRYSAGEAMTFGGSTEAAAFVEIRGIGEPSAQQKKSCAQEVTQLVSKKLEVPEGRIFVTFQGFEGKNWAMAGSLFG